MFRAKRKVCLSTEPMPDRLVSRVSPVESFENPEGTIDRGGFLEHMLERWKEAPFFLRQSIEQLSGLGGVSLDDFFWIGGRQEGSAPLPRKRTAGPGESPAEEARAFRIQTAVPATGVRASQA
jgi:hypothetical protein